MSPTSYLTAPPRNCIVTIHGGLVNLPLNYLEIKRPRPGWNRARHERIVEIANDVETSGPYAFSAFSVDPQPSSGSLAFRLRTCGLRRVREGARLPLQPLAR